MSRRGCSTPVPAAHARRRAKMLATRAALVLAAWLVAAAAPALAGNPCSDGGSATPGSGIGGTGRTDAGPGIGGTGRDSGDSGIGGTGRDGDSGIGGTGARPDGPGDGIGGTGRARIIVGTVTGYASVCVNGIEVHIDDVGGDADLPAIGEVVEIVAVGAGDSVRARSIERRPVVVGPVAHVDKAGGRLRVLGQDVALGASVRMHVAGADRPASIDAFETGSVVRISGWRRPDGTIDASRIDPAAGDVAIVSGTVTAIGGGAIEIDGTRVDVSAAASFAAAVGDRVTARGRARGEALAASEVAVTGGDWKPVGAERLDVESVVGSDGRTVAIGARKFRVPAGKAAAGSRVRISARVAPDGGLVFERIRPAIAPRPPGVGMHPGHGRPPGDRPGGHRLHPPQRPDRPERPPFPDRPPPRPPRGVRPPPPPPPPPPRIQPPPRIELPARPGR